MDEFQTNSSLKTTYSKFAGSNFSPKRVSLALGLIFLVFTVIIIFGMEPGLHYHDSGGTCKRSGWLGLGQPARRRTCLCLGALNPTMSGWFEGPSSYTCGGLGVSFESPASAAGNISYKINKIINCFSIIGSGSDYEVGSKCKFLF